MKRESSVWQGQKDSNPQQRFWRPTCYHYTMPLLHSQQRYYMGLKNDCQVFFTRSAGKVIHHDPCGYSGVQRFGAAAHRETKTVRRNCFHGFGNAVSLVANDQYK